MALPPSMIISAHAAIHDDDVHVIRNEIELGWDIQTTRSVGLTTSDDNDVPVFERSVSRILDDEYCSVDFQCCLESMNPKYETSTIKEHIDIGKKQLNYSHVAQMI